MSEWYRWDGADLLLKLKLQPGSRQDAFAGQQEDRMRVRVTAPPVDGKANNRLLAWLAKQFAVSKTSVSIESGHSSPLKRVRIKNPGRIPDCMKNVSIN